MGPGANTSYSLLLVVRPLKDKDKRDFPPLAVYDIESVDWIKVKLLCHLDEWGNELYFDNVGDYLRFLLTDFPGDRVWAHFGSGYDNRFLVEELHRWMGSSYKAVMSGGLPIIFEIQNDAYTVVSKKNGKIRNRRVVLLDSFRWLPTTLASIGKSVGLPKMEVDRSRIEQLSPKELRDYCMHDCRVLLRGMQRFRDTVIAQGGTFAITSASIASNFIRADPTIKWQRFFEPDDNYQTYSGSRFARFEPGSKPGMLQADEFSESAYFGGRCEVFRRGYAKGPLYYYDIASAYPWAMTQKLPLYFLGFEPGARSDDEKGLLSILKRSGVSDARVYIPQGTFEIPPLPVRAPGGKVVFAEGRFHGRWCNCELLALYKRGAAKGVRIDIGGWARFTAEPFAAELVRRFYRLRKQAKDSGDDAVALTLKILMNSAYGKLAQQLEQSSYVYGDAYEFIVDAAKEAGTWRPSPMPGLSEIVEESEGPFRHVAAGAYVTALARLKLLEGMERAITQGANVYYCDTDSIVVDKPIKGWGGSTELGAWELEKQLVEGEFLCPKVYRARELDGTWTLKAKGNNLKSQLELSEPAARHARERLLRWLVYAQEISAHARTELASYTLTESELVYYGKTEAGLKGWRTTVAGQSVDCLVATLDRHAQNADSKRQHNDLLQRSKPLYLEGEQGDYYDMRTLDPESLIELELGELGSNEYQDRIRDNP